MSEDIRTERTFGVTAELKPVQRMHLHFFLNSEAYPDVLDVMEMVCIETETRLINTPAEDEAAVLANHKMAKVAWQLFTHIQEKIHEQSKLHLASVTKKPPVPPLTPEEELQENILNPTHYMRIETEAFE